MDNQLSLFGSPAHEPEPKPTLPVAYSGKIIYETRGKAREYRELAANLYSGCDHGCVYCLDGDTLLHRVDMSLVKIKDVQVGDTLIGVTENTTGTANEVKFTSATVLNKWETTKRAYRVTLENGMTVICSGDHRWLTDRGWKFTTGEMTGQDQRPYLTTNNYVRVLPGVLYQHSYPNTDSYKKGYLSGMVRGDGHLAVHNGLRSRKGKNSHLYRATSSYQFILRLKDDEALERTFEYLSHFGVLVNRFKFTSTMNGIRITNRSDYETINHLIEWSDDPDYMRGFLSGIYDAEGSFSRCVRIANSDNVIVQFIEKSMTKFGFGFVRDVPHTGKNTIIESIRLQGGLPEILRFWNLIDPAITRKRTVINTAVKANSRVVSIEDLGYEMKMYDIQTSSENFIANGMVSHNCYAPNVIQRNRVEFHTDVHIRTDILKGLEKDARGYAGAHEKRQVLFCFTTDPYYTGEDAHKTTRAALQIMRSHGMHFCTLTKGGTRALRDLDLFTPDDAFASTLTSLDESVSLEWEPNAAIPFDRLVALAAFHKAGIPTWVSLEPVIDPEQSKRIIRTAYEYVDEFKVGVLNYHPLAKEIDWKRFGFEVVELLESLGKRYYIKYDLKKAMGLV